MIGPGLTDDDLFERIRNDFAQHSFTRSSQDLRTPSSARHFVRQPRPTRGIKPSHAVSARRPVEQLSISPDHRGPRRTPMALTTGLVAASLVGLIILAGQRTSSTDIPASAFATNGADATNSPVHDPTAAGAGFPTNSSIIDPVTTEPSTITADTTTAGDTTRTVSPTNGANIAGETIGELKIPKINLDIHIESGTNNAQLNSGIGHEPSTPLPGQLGNAVLVGNRTTHLAPFHDLDHLTAGDEIRVTTVIGSEYVYKVTNTETVDKTAIQYLVTVDHTQATLTLVTCTPIGTSSHRLVVQASLDLTQTPTSPSGTPPYADPTPIVQDDPATCNFVPPAPTTTPKS